MKQGNIGVTTENIFPVIKKFLYSDHEIFLREIISNAVDATQKLKTLSGKGEFKGVHKGKPDANDLHAIKELIHRRRRKSSTIFCSQILKEGWYEALGGENTEAEAILDRITYDGYNINIEYIDPSKAVSMRKLYSRLKPID